MKPHIIIFRFIILIALLGAAFCSSGCISAMVLSSGKTERRVFPSDPTPATRVHIEKKIGTPVETHQLDSLPTLGDFRTLAMRLGANKYDISFRQLWPSGWLPVVRVYSPRSGMNANAGFYGPNALSRKYYEEFNEYGPITYARYAYKGRVVPSELQHAYVATSLISWGIAEPLLIPLALVTRVTRSTNYIDVWYDATGYALAYTWSVKPHEAAVF